MTRPDWCPAEVWDAIGDMPVSTEAVARAILLERERCAAVAEGKFSLATVIKNKAGKPYSSGNVAIYAAAQIAAAIRAGANHASS